MDQHQIFAMSLVTARIYRCKFTLRAAAMPFLLPPPATRYVAAAGVLLRKTLVADGTATSFCWPLAGPKLSCAELPPWKVRTTSSEQWVYGIGNGSIPKQRFSRGWPSQRWATERGWRWENEKPVLVENVLLCGRKHPVLPAVAGALPWPPWRLRGLSS